MSEYEASAASSATATASTDISGSMSFDPSIGGATPPPDDGVPAWTPPADSVSSDPGVLGSLHSAWFGDDDDVSDPALMRAANDGISDVGSTLPHLEEVQRAFGAEHDLSSIAAHTGASAVRAADQLGANAFATGDHVAFGSATDRWTVAHEATHVVQQRNGVAPRGLGEVGGHSEREADAVADAVVRGESVAPLLASMSGNSNSANPSGGSLQLDRKGNATLTDAKPSGGAGAINWLDRRQAPGTPVRPATINVPASPPIPRGSRLEHAGTWRETPPGHRRELVRGEVHQETGDDLQNWNAYKQVAAEADSRHALMAERLAMVRAAEKDQQLRSLDFSVLEDAKNVGLTDLTEQQHVPFENGPSVGSLFRGTDAKVTPEDQATIQSGRDSVKQGRGETEGIQARNADVIGADENLTEATKGLQRVGAKVSQARDSLAAAVARASAFEDKNAAEDLRADAELLRSKTGRASELVSMLGDVAALIMHAATGGVGDAVDKAGSLVASIVGQIEDVNARLKSFQAEFKEEQFRTKQGRSLALDLSAAAHGVSAEESGLGELQSRLNKALGTRRKAYGALATTAKGQMSGSDESRTKVAGMIAAIPLVEQTHAKFSTLSETCLAPGYSTSAGLGLAAAKSAGQPSADEFLRACAELNYTRMWSREQEGMWQERLASLNAVKRSLVGRKAGD